jgi:hypothetical protein
MPACGLPDWAISERKLGLCQQLFIQAHGHCCAKAEAGDEYFCRQMQHELAPAAKPA